MLLSPLTTHSSWTGPPRETDEEQISIPATLLSVGRSYVRAVVDSDTSAATLRSLEPSKFVLSSVTQSVCSMHDTGPQVSKCASSGHAETVAVV